MRRIRVGECVRETDWMASAAAANACATIMGERCGWIRPFDGTPADGTESCRRGDLDRIPCGVEGEDRTARRCRLEPGTGESGLRRGVILVEATDTILLDTLPDDPVGGNARDRDGMEDGGGIVSDWKSGWGDATAAMGNAGTSDVV